MEDLRSRINNAATEAATQHGLNPRHSVMCAVGVNMACKMGQALSSFSIGKQPEIYAYINNAEQVPVAALFASVTPVYIAGKRKELRISSMGSIPETSPYGGSRLVHAACTQAMEMGATSAKFKALKHPGTVEFYERCGFKVADDLTVSTDNLAEIKNVIDARLVEARLNLEELPAIHSPTAVVNELGELIEQPTISIELS